ncbi:MAG: SGNH/GDSL hydrolase family protein [Lachnospiraceae bacterium]|nr:SGNH/GDSL hydrolase family protein [Lachnospiraceae bacterium]
MQEKLNLFKNRLKNIKINYHLIIIVIIVIIFLITLFILLRWNKGVESSYDPDLINTDFDVEPLDFIMHMDPRLLEGREDDGELHILCLGNNPFSDETGENGLAQLIAKETAGITYNGAFPDSMIANRKAPANVAESFGLFYVTMALVNNDFAYLRESAGKTQDKRYADAVDVLENLDLNKIDVLVMMYDTTDYNQLSPADDPNNEYNIDAYTGSLRTSIEVFKEHYPHIRIIMMSHSYAMYMDEEGVLHNGTVTDLGNGDIPHYLIMGFQVATSSGITFIDNYFGTIHEENFHEYMRDHMHYNDVGRRLLAKRVAEIILDE